MDDSILSSYCKSCYNYFVPASCTDLQKRGSSESSHEEAKAMNLLSLPPEVHLQIFALLDITTSTCLGITCHHLYSIHQSINGKSRLNFFDTPHLPFLLKEWMKPDFVFCGKEFVFMRSEKVESLKAKERDYLDGYFKRMKLAGAERREKLVDRLMESWEREFGGGGCGCMVCSGLEKGGFEGDES